jgi:hypothetical protein
MNAGAAAFFKNAIMTFLKNVTTAVFVHEYSHNKLCLPIIVAKGSALL